MRERKMAPESAAPAEPRRNEVHFHFLRGWPNGALKPTLASPSDLSKNKQAQLHSLGMDQRRSQHSKQAQQCHAPVCQPLHGCVYDSNHAMHRSIQTPSLFSLHLYNQTAKHLLFACTEPHGGEPVWLVRASPILSAHQSRSKSFIRMKLLSRFLFLYCHETFDSTSLIS